MTKIFLTVLTLSLSCFIYGQDGLNNLISKNKVKTIYEISSNGKINNVDTIGYKIYNKNFKLIEEYSKSYPFKHIFLYNKDGLLIKKLKLDNQNNENIKRQWKYEYDKKGKLTKEVSYWSDFKGKHPVLYTYNKQNQLINTNHINNNGKVYKSFKQKYYESGELYENLYEEKHNKSAYKIERFDKCGNLIYLFRNGKQDNTFVENNSLSHCPNLLNNENFVVDTIFVKNKKEQTIRYTSQDNNRKSIYNYYTSGELKSFTKSQYKKDGALNWSLEEFYNTQGNLIEYRKLYHWRTCNYSSDNRLARIHKKFEYYQNGLLSKINFFDENEIITRIIEYKIVNKE